MRDRSSRWRARFLRFAFHHFYNSFAWSYDAVSTAVSLGHWREWSRAAIPYLRGRRVLEIAFGTGNLQLDMRLTPGPSPMLGKGEKDCFFGLDLSPDMARIAARKLRRAGAVPSLVRGNVLDLPFAEGAFDSLVLTFPPNFLAAPQAVSEMRRVLAGGGRLIMVDAGWVRKPALVGALINLAFRFTGSVDIRADRLEPLRAAGFAAQVVEQGDTHSTVQVLIAEKSPSGG
ncbi:MAG: class I SAM-dependent methyltransferase [Chloroflexi bacterium]|nr:class I SAM-dependent methyltransferase [Chloroflexota bacterium]